MYIVQGVTLKKKNERHSLAFCLIPIIPIEDVRK